MFLIYLTLNLSVATTFMWGAIALTVECEFTIITYKDNNQDVLAPDIYVCTMANITRECDSSKKVVAVSTNHMPGKSNDDVELFHTKVNQKIYNIPREIGRIFPNLIVVTMPFVELQQVRSQDLENFPNLRFLYLGNNKIKTLDSDLFKYTPKLEYLSVDYNQLTNIGTDILAPLMNLERLYLSQNPCLPVGGTSNRSGIEALKKLMEEQCPPVTRRGNQEENSQNQLADDFNDDLESRMNDEISEKCLMKYGIKVAAKDQKDSEFKENKTKHEVKPIFSSDVKTISDGKGNVITVEG